MRTLNHYKTFCCVNSHNLFLTEPFQSNLSEKFPMDKIFRQTRFSTPSRNFDNIVRQIFVWLGISLEYLWNIWFLLTKISYKVKRHTYKIYQKWNKSVAHQTNTCNTRLLHVNLGVISLLHHAKIYYAVDYYENPTTSNTSCNTSRKVLPTSRNSKIPKIFMQSFKQSPAYLVGSTTMKYYL